MAGGAKTDELAEFLGPLGPERGEGTVVELRGGRDVRHLDRNVINHAASVPPEREIGAMFSGSGSGSGPVGAYR
ncbi:hypothetical protein Sliba_62540 [Streptomyces nigrescens]|uniref:Uncharacterized protein n=1 Tax=Streptomyces nigrescens TaxID=1920 RepID=A0A640TU99_STRNI|nr:hypothetical protein Sliba_62540 [Streptomyces libani subsp. libani]GGW03326.1 hypothetical protein GCM10010500_62630 [Streptomyces libani subsp. libani]